MPSRNERGFTLIELLITISIIAILSAIGLIAYSAVLKQGRDSKRQSDLRSVQSALEQYNSDQGFYPAASPSPFTPGGSLTSTTGNPSPNPSASPKVYMNTIPSDPLPSPQYNYVPLPSNSSYCLCAKLENSSNPEIISFCSSACSSYNFAVTPP